MFGSAASERLAAPRSAQLSLVNDLAASLLRAPAQDRSRRAVDVLARAGIRASVADGRLTLPAGLDRELASALRNVFALALASRPDDDAALLAALVRSAKPAAVGQLTAGVAHEINNPLFAILGLVEFALNEIEPGTKAHARLTLVHETGLEIKEIVRALVDFAREPADDLQLLQLGEVAAQTLELVRRTTSAKDVEIVDRIGDEPARVHATRNQLKQILVNLLTNAAQAMPGGGTVTVALECDGAWAVVTVSDTGPGIADDVRARIFEPFFTTRQGKTGLGLAISRAIAEAHGGTLDARSDADTGATFVLRLPLAATDRSA